MTRLLRRAAALVVCVMCAAPQGVSAQERGAVALGEAVAGLDVTARVLVIGAHPDDEDTQLITWLARGRQVETAYLSLTRGDGGQNLIGNELGPLLGMIRTEELLAARRLDGGRQFFTRAYDFGFSKSAEETYTHWVKDSILRDVVTVVRAFRPQVIVAVFSGTPRDGHGHHQVSGMLAREVFDAAADTLRFPARTTAGYGAWAASKFYRAARFNQAEATLSFNVGELSALRGSTYAEMASESRSQHLSQGFGALQRRGTSMDYLTLEASRLPGGASAHERSPVDGLWPGFVRFASAPVPDSIRARLDSLPAAIAEVRRAEQLAAPSAMVAPLTRVVRLMGIVNRSSRCEAMRTSIVYDRSASTTAPCTAEMGDLDVTMRTALERAQRALLAASGVLIEATVSRELIAVNDTVPVTISVYNQGRETIGVAYAAVSWSRGSRLEGSVDKVPPDSVAQLQIRVPAVERSAPWWLAWGRDGDMFRQAGQGTSEEELGDFSAYVALDIGGVRLANETVPIVNRAADPARGERRRPLAAVPIIAVTLDDDVQFARAGAPFDRTYRVHVRSGASVYKSVSVALQVSGGLAVDTAVRLVVLQPYAEATVTFRVRGKLLPGRYPMSAVATSNGESYTSGYLPIVYEHIRPLRYYRRSALTIVAVSATLPRNVRIAYIRGVGDNVAPMLAQLGLVVSTVPADQVETADLSGYGAVVVGPRAFAASGALIASAGRLQQFARNGGTVVVQYGQGEMQAPGILPYPITLARTAQRVTDERAPITVLDSGSRLLVSPNRITPADFDGWVQERSLYMPTTADPHYATLLEMHDPGEPPNLNAVLVAPLGKGAYVYTTLALFRQLPAGVPGAARLFLNLLAADGHSSGKRPLTP